MRYIDEDAALLAKSQAQACYYKTEPSAAEQATHPNGQESEVTSVEDRWQEALLAAQQGDNENAFKLVFALADNAQHPPALNWLACWYFYGGQPLLVQDKVEGRRLFELAASLYDVTAMLNLAHVLKESGSAEDKSLSDDWLLRAARAGNVQACVDLCMAWGKTKAAETPGKAELERLLENALAGISRDDPWAAIFAARLLAFGPSDWRRLDLAWRALTPWCAATEALHSPPGMVSKEWGDPVHELQLINAWLLETQPGAKEVDKQQAAQIYSSLKEATQGVQPGKTLAFFAMSAVHGLNGYDLDHQRALAFLERGAALGDAKMQFDLADVLKCGYFLPGNEPEVVVFPVNELRYAQLLRLSVEGGHLDAMVDLAQRYSDGLWGFQKDFALARQWLERALQGELSFYQLVGLGGICQKGQAALNDDQLEASIWQRCVNKMREEKLGKSWYAPEAMLSYALQLWEGRGVRQDRVEAERLLNQSVEASDKMPGYWEFAIAASFAKEVIHPGIHEHRNRVDSETALVWLRKSAEAGYPDAMWSLSASLGRVDYLYEFSIHKNKFHNFPEDKAESLHWLSRLAESGDVAAKEILAVTLLRGQPYEQDVDTAERLLKQLEPSWSEKAAFEKMLRVADYWETLGEAHNGRQRAAYWRNLARKLGGAAADRSLALELSQRAQDGQSEQATQAFLLMDEVARSGNLPAMLDAGLWLLKGYGTPVDEGAADQWFARYTAKQPDDATGAETERVNSLAESLLQATPRDLTRGLKWLELAAESGNVDAVLSCGIARAEGIGTERDLGKAEQYFSRLFELEPESATAKLLSMHYDLLYVSVLEKHRMSDVGRVIALKLCVQRGASDAAGKAMYRLGNIYSSGRIVEVVDRNNRREEPDFAEAFHWYKLSAEKAYPPAYEALAKCFTEGRGTNANQALAQQWWLRASDRGSVSAMITLGIRAFKGIGQSPDASGAHEWFNKAVQESDDSPSNIASEVFDENDVTTHRLAYEWLVRAVSRKPIRGDLLRVARHHALGWGVPQNFDEADRWLDQIVASRVSDGKDLKEAMVRVASIWQGNENFPRNPEHALVWLRRAAELGDADACRLLGEAYATGYGVSVNPARAEEWFLKGASRTKHWDARMRLVYWWARWERKDRSTLVKTWLGEVAREDTSNSGEFAKAATLAAFRVFRDPPTDNEFRQKYYLEYASNSYKYGCELAMLGMSASNGASPKALLKSNTLLSMAICQIKKDQSNFEVVGDAEVAYVEGLCVRASQLKSRHWFLRLFGI